MAIKVIVQTPGMSYRKPLDMREAGHAADARRARAAESVVRNVLHSVRCVKHEKQDVYVIVLFEESAST